MNEAEASGLYSQLLFDLNPAFWSSQLCPLLLNQVIDPLTDILCWVTSICTSKSPLQLSLICSVSRRLISMELINRFPCPLASCQATKWYHKR